MDEREKFYVRSIFQLLSALHFISTVNGPFRKDINILWRTVLFHYYSDPTIIPLMSKKRLFPYIDLFLPPIFTWILVHSVDKYSHNSWFALEKKAMISLKCPNLVVVVAQIWGFPAVVIFCRKIISSLRDREVFLPVQCLIIDAVSLLQIMIISEREGKNYLISNPQFFC